MRWPRRGILIRLAIYVPVIGFLAWRAQGGCSEPGRMEMEKDDPIEQKLAPHRKVITLPDGTQQEIVELTAEEAEAILGHPIPKNLDAAAGKAGGDAKAGDAKPADDAKAGGDAKADADAKAGGDAKPIDDAKAGGDAKTDVDAKAGDAKIGADAKAIDTKTDADTKAVTPAR